MIAVQPNIKSKIPDTGISIFAIMSKLANEHDAVNLSQGFPDFSCPPKLVELVSHYMKKGMNQYASMPGLPQLREQLADKMNYLYGVPINPDSEITITPGATNAIYNSITALVHEGDEVIIIDPAYDCYAPAVQLCGGIPVHIDTVPPNFKIDWNKVQSCITDKTKMIVINTPHNPACTIFDQNDITSLYEIIKDKDIFILSDEVYEHIVFDNNPHLSIVNNPLLRERSVATFSFGKVFHNTGWKMGYTVAPEHITAEIRKVHQFNTFSCNTPIQHALTDFLKDQNTYLELNEFFQEKRDYFLSLLKGSRFKWTPSSGSYFQLLDYSNITNEADTEVAKYWTQEFKIASIPLSVFYKSQLDHKQLRFCFAKSNETLEKAANILCKI